MVSEKIADKLGISTDNLKKMKRGHYQSSYIKRGKYYFAVQEAVRRNQDLSHLNVPGKDRGNHFKGKYPNASFPRKEQLRMLAKLTQR